MNRTILVGRPTKDVQLNYTQDGLTAFAKFTLAVNRPYKKDGKSEADFIPITCWGKIAENAATFIKKGKLISVAGSIQTGHYEAKDGTRRYTVDVRADYIEYLSATQNVPNSYNNDNYIDNNDDLELIDDGDIPF